MCLDVFTSKNESEKVSTKSRHRMHEDGVNGRLLSDNLFKPRSDAIARRNEAGATRAINRQHGAQLAIRNGERVRMGMRAMGMCKQSSNQCARSELGCSDFEIFADFIIASASLMRRFKTWRTFVVRRQLRPERGVVTQS